MNCIDCNCSVCYEYFMVKDSVWEAARMQRNGGQLCIGSPRGTTRLEAPAS
jgi:hypothetical protein